MNRNIIILASLMIAALSLFIPFYNEKEPEKIETTPPAPHEEAHETVILDNFRVVPDPEKERAKALQAEMKKKAEQEERARRERLERQAEEERLMRERQAEEERLERKRRAEEERAQQEEIRRREARLENERIRREKQAEVERTRRADEKRAQQEEIRQREARWEKERIVSIPFNFNGNTSVTIPIAMVRFGDKLTVSSEQVEGIAGTIDLGLSHSLNSLVGSGVFSRASIGQRYQGRLDQKIFEYSNCINSENGSILYITINARTGYPAYYRGRRGGYGTSFDFINAFRPRSGKGEIIVFGDNPWKIPPKTIQSTQAAKSDRSQARADTGNETSFSKAKADYAGGSLTKEGYKALVVKLKLAYVNEVNQLKLDYRSGAIDRAEYYRRATDIKLKYR